MSNADVGGCVHAASWVTGPRIHETVAGERVWYIARTELVNNKGLG